MRSILWSALLVCACDGTTPNNVKSGTGTIHITSPVNNSIVTPGTPGSSVDVAFTVNGFKLASAGTCAGAANCGHVHMVVDGIACNDTSAAGPYNNDGFASPISIHLLFCPAVSGSHKIVAELHNDDHSYYTSAADININVTDSVTINVP